LEASGFRVLGVDIWIRTLGAPRIPTPYVYDLSLDHHPERVDGIRAAREFVRSFVWDPNDLRPDDPYFNITVED
jgi:hypothetical protein